jgi:hypothetical protein
LDIDAKNDGRKTEAKLTVKFPEDKGTPWEASLTSPTPSPLKVEPYPGSKEIEVMFDAPAGEFTISIEREL